MTPNDSFHFLTGNQVTYNNASLVTLYQPLIGSDAVMTYSYLVAFFDNGRAGHRFTELLNHLQFGFQVLTTSLDRLGAVGLIDFYLSPQGYHIKLYQAKSREEFLAEPVLRSLLASRIGEVATEDLFSSLPDASQVLTKKFSEVFTNKGEFYAHQPSRTSLDMGYLKSKMLEAGLRFSDETTDILGLTALAETHKLNWLELFRLAQQTAVNRQISLKRMTAQLEKKETSSSSWTESEQATLKVYKNHDALSFLQLMKQSRQAQVLESERKLLAELGELGFLDEVINVLVSKAMSRTANLNKVYVMKMANDFLYHKVKTAEEAMTYLKQGLKSSSAHSSNQTTKSNVPVWSDQDYKNDTSQEEQERLEAYKRQRLAELERED